MFDKLIGNNHVKEILQRMLRARRVPNSLLFMGADGIGKREFALETAKAFVCQNPTAAHEACDACGACRRAEKVNFPNSRDKDDNEKIFFSEHPDIGLLRQAGKFITVNQMRELETESNFRPYEAAARFFLIDDAEKMNEAAANALLKTLEEPSTTAHIFLITSRPAALLPTIRSRCQTLRFAPVEAKQIEGFLESKKQFSVSDAELLSKFARGSVGRALELDLGKFRERREAMLKVLESLSGKPNRAVLLKTAEEICDAKIKDYYENFLEILETLIHDLWTLRLGKDEIVNADLKPKLERLSENAEAARLSAWLTEIETMRENFTVNLNRKIATDALFMQMAHS
ncbi:MAG TPA: DNA polymerase III subunit delta' [Pyrinomonadaceae bacterium]|nr:DNA polymerase III subunit delta' [Pyrinomonadaceae bacterium]